MDDGFCLTAFSAEHSKTISDLIIREQAVSHTQAGFQAREQSIVDQSVCAFFSFILQLIRVSFLQEALREFDNKLSAKAAALRTEWELIKRTRETEQVNGSST